MLTWVIVLAVIISPSLFISGIIIIALCRGTAESVDHVMDEWHTALAHFNLAKRRTGYVFDTQARSQIMALVGLCEELSRRPPRRRWYSWLIDDKELFAMQRSVSQLQQMLDLYSVKL